MKLGMAQQYVNAGKYPEAEALFKQLITEQPENIPAQFQLGLLYQRMGHRKPAIEIMQKIIALNPQHVNAHLKLGEWHHAASLHDEAQHYLDAMEALNPQNFQHWVLLGQLYTKHGQHQKALFCMQKALRLDDNRFEIWSNLAATKRDLGDLQGAAESFSQAIALNPDCAEAHLGLATLTRYSPESVQFKALQELALKKDIPPASRCQAAYGLAKALEDNEQFDQAFEYMLMANTIERESQSYSPQLMADLIKNLKDVFNDDYVERVPGSKIEDKGPIFIVGMPRSGTSLVEQILASHSNVFGAGELLDVGLLVETVGRTTGKRFPTDFPKLTAKAMAELGNSYLNHTRGLANGEKYITDKMPQNFLFVGFIFFLFRNAKIIHCKRNPADTALSIFKNFFLSGHDYSHDLSELGHYYWLYQGLMQHWHTVFPFKIYDVEYEELVSNPEEEIRALLNYCDLPFESGCLEFHKTQRPVATISASQVRQPISQASVAGWKRYEQYFEPFLTALKSGKTHERTQEK